MYCGDCVIVSMAFPSILSVCREDTAPDTKTHPTTILNYESFVAFETKFDEF